MRVDEGREAISGMKSHKPQTLADGLGLTCQGYTRANHHGPLLYQRCGMHVIKQNPALGEWVKNIVHRYIRNRPQPPLLFIPLVITHRAYVSVGHLSLKPSKDTVHPCLLNGFI